MREDKSRLLLPLLKRTLWDLENTLSLRTLENYRSAISKVREFAGDNWQRLTVTAITRQWTDNFTRWLQQQHADKPQTVDFYLRTFRAVYRHALNLTESTANAKPFGGPRPGGGFSAKRALKRDDMLKILSPELREKLKPRQIEALDVLVFIFYSRGMAFQDVYRLRWGMISDGHIRYKRSKTGALIDVEVVPELEEIMRRYHRKDSPYVLPFLHESRKGNTGKELSEKSALRRINRAVYNIIGDVKLTTYVLRHTWATLMLEDGSKVEVISQCMGHSSIRTTQIYLSRISSRKIDKAVRGMYDRQLRHNVPEETKVDITETKSPLPPQMVGQNHGLLSLRNKKCPFLTKKVTSILVPNQQVLLFECKGMYFTQIRQMFWRLFYK